MMKKLFIGGILAALPSLLAAQTAIDAMSISQSDLRGSARFMSMGGAFTALGGDISTLGQNPGGIGVYRSSDFSATLDINMQNGKSVATGLTENYKKTHTAFNNFGFVGAIDLNNEVMPYFNWGVSFNRTADFNRRFRGPLGNLASSYTNLVADNTTYDQIIPEQLSIVTQGYNPYRDQYRDANGNYYDYAPWSSILLYRPYAISALNNGSYVGLYDYGTTVGGGYYEMNESGYVDEYNFNVGGNVMNTLYWGLGFGVTDLNFTQSAYYEENLQQARILTADGSEFTRGDAFFGMENYKRIYGSGVNFKAGVILKPINEFRIGVAVHTPTYYDLNYEGYAKVNTRFMGNDYLRPVTGESVTDEGYLDEFGFQSRTPWRLMVGAAGVVGGRFIISGDYELRATGDLSVQDSEGYEYKDVNEDLKTYYQNTNIMRLGAEYRLTPSVSLRAGYSYESSPVKQTLLDNTKSPANYVYTSGPDDTETQPAYTLERSTSYVTAGLGYRYDWFYADAAFVHRNRHSDYHAYTNYNENANPNAFIEAPKAAVSQLDNSIVLTVGIRF